jgi:hypothetical protein
MTCFRPGHDLFAIVAKRKDNGILLNSDVKFCPTDNVVRFMKSFFQSVFQQRKRKSMSIKFDIPQ